MVTAVTPVSGPHVVTVGGTAVSIVLPPAQQLQGCYITNPAAAADQAIGTAENLYIDPTGIPATLVGNGSCVTIAPGQTWRAIPGQTTGISVNAATSGHQFTLVRW